MRVTVTTDRHGDVIAHRAGCQHLDKLTPHADLYSTFEAASATDVAQYVWADQIAESDLTANAYLNFTLFAPCLRDLPTKGA